MLCVSDPGLEQNASESLIRYQEEVDSENTYSEQVEKAKTLFFRYRNNRTFRVVRATLKKMYRGVQRCNYCEDSTGNEIEHIKPKDIYPKYTFVWENYLLSCGICNRSKSNRFSVLDRRGQLIDVTPRSGDAIRRPPSGSPALVNPRREDPLEFFDLEITDTFLFVPRNGLHDTDLARSEYTINLLKLNRDVLLKARRKAYDNYRAQLKEYISRQENGANGIELETLKTGILSLDHPTVWREMQRQNRDIEELRRLFEIVPEALEW